jgi:O-methyltransferase
MMAVALTLRQLGVSDVDLYLFDTFEGMTKPAPPDIDYAGVPAEVEFERTRLNHDSSEWCRSPIEDVQKNLLATGYPPERIKLVRGSVEQTIPVQAPDRVSLLRLDTDWYESTKHELIHMYPRLSCGGVLIIDDYGHWHGSRKATDEYFSSTTTPILLNRIDYTGRISVKCRD